MNLARRTTAVLAAAALATTLLGSPPPPAEAQSLPDLGLDLDVITTAAQLPDAILDQLPASAADVGLAYAPRLVEVQVRNRAERNALASSGLDVTEHAGDDHLQVVLHDPAHEQVIRDLGLDFEVVTADLITLERDRILADAAYFRSVQESPLPSGRTTYRVLAEFGEEIDQLAADNPDLVKRISLGESVEGRDLTGVEIGVDVNAPEDGRPVMLMFGNHHAREWPSAEAPMEFAHDLVDTFNAGDARTIDLLSRARVIIVPVSNPDGFDASRTSGDLIDLDGTVPQDLYNPVTILGTPGNAYKRKNCRYVDGQTQPAGTCVLIPSPGGYGIGIDLNRNYGALWGGPGADSGPLPGIEEDGAAGTGTNSPIYHGPAPFSEPETQAIRELISTRQVTTLISNHTFSNLLLRPVGVEPSTIGPDGFPVGFAPDECFTDGQGRDAGMQALGERMTAQTGYSNQFGWELYDTTGTTEDYSYNATGGYGYTFEIGPEQFHPPYEEFVAEYDGTAASAQAVTPETAPDLTTSVGRACPGADPDHTESGVGGGLREAYFLALENAADRATHSVLTGTAPEGAEIGVTRTGTFPLWDGTPVEDTVATSMVVGPDGVVEYHVNPSTRPFVDARPYVAEGDAPAAEPEVVETREETGSTQPVGAVQDVPVEVGEGIDSLRIAVTAMAPDDYDIELLSPDLVPLDSSAGEFTDEVVAFSRPTGIAAGTYVLRIENYAAVGGWTAAIELGTLPDDAGATDQLAFTPRTEEAWTVTCTIDGAVVATRDVVVDRGQSRDLGAVCDPAAAVGVTRLSGGDRLATAIAVSEARFAEPDSAGAVVLARGDDPNGFADALAGGPLAVDRDAPLLITDPDGLRDDVAAEIDRVLPEGGTVYLLGGPAALSPAIEAELVGYEVVRLFGADRHETAVAVADELGNPDLVLIATGGTFPDALAASAAAAAGGGAVLLTTADAPQAATTAYLEEHAPTEVIAVGGPAARAYPAAEPIAGGDRFATAVALADRLFDQPTVAGIARGDAFPDALAGAAHIGAIGGPVLLTPSTGLDVGVASHLCDGAFDDAFVYGGSAAIGDSVMAELQAVLDGTACVSATAE